MNIVNLTCKHGYNLGIDHGHRCVHDQLWLKAPSMDESIHFTFLQKGHQEGREQLYQELCCGVEQL